MIDKSIALNLSIQLKDSNKSLDDLNKLLVKSKEHLKNVGKNSKEFKKLDASVKKVENSMSKSSKTITKMGGSTKKLNTNIAATGKAAAVTASGTGALGGSMVLADRATGGLASKMLFLKTAAGKVVQSLKSVKVAMMATGIGLLLVAVLALKAAFTSSEEGQNKFAKIMGVIGAITGNLVDLLADLGEKIISVFEDPQKALNDFGALIKENIVNRFDGLMELIPALGKAIGLLFEGEFSEAGKVAVNAVAKVTTGIDDFTGMVGNAIDKTKEFYNEQVREGNLAAKVANMRAKADKIDRALIVERSILESKIAELRLKAKKEDEVSAKDRRQALLDARDLEETLLDAETKALSLRRDAQVLENTFSRTNKENLDKEANSIAAVNLQIAKRATVARTLQRELNTVNAQVATEESKLAAEKIAAEKELAAAIEGIRVANINGEDEKRAEEKRKVDKQYEELLAKAKKYELDASGLDEARIAKKQEIDDKYVKAKAEKDLAEQEKLIGKLKYDQKTAEDEFQLRREEIARRELIVAEDKTLTEEQRLQLQKQFAAESVNITKAEEAAKAELAAQRLQLAGNILGAISGLSEAFAKDDEKSQKKQFELNKVASIGNAIINTATGVTKAIAQGGVAGIATGVFVAAAGVAQIATIAKTKYKAGGTSVESPSSPNLGNSGAGSQPRAFTSPRVDTSQSTTKVIVTETDIRSVTGNVSGIYNRAIVVE
tara:strand:+ start:579 stop:2744 length:2166 start_codon:yes stop_codon:yes gene_type:complete